MFERFTPAAREVVEAAQREAAQLSHSYIGTEHLLFGLLDDSAAPGAAARVLAAIGLEPAHVHSEILRLVDVGTGPQQLGDSEAAALQAIGIDLAAVRSKLEDSFGEGVLEQAQQPPCADRRPLRAGRRLTQRAKKSLQLALREARRLGDDSLGPEHILLGLIQEGRGIAAQIIAAKAPLPAVRNELLAELERAA